MMWVNHPQGAETCVKIARVYENWESINNSSIPAKSFSHF